MVGGAISGEGFRWSEKGSGDRKRFSGDEVWLSLSPNRPNEVVGGVFIGEVVQ